MRRRIAAKILVRVSRNLQATITRTYNIDPCRSSRFHLCFTFASSPCGSGTYFKDHIDTGILPDQLISTQRLPINDPHDSGGYPEIPSPSTHLPSVRYQLYQTSNLNTKRSSQSPTKRVYRKRPRKLVLLKYSRNQPVRRRNKRGC